MESRARAPNILIVGGNGFLGSHLARSLRKRARVTVTYRLHRVPLDGVLSLPIDIRNVDVMKKLIFSQRPDVVIYLGGPEDQAWAEANQKDAEKVFSSGTAEILFTSDLVGARFIYISSPTVFDATRGNYTETDNLSPISLLGKVKASGENIIRGRSNNSSILRISPLVGSAHPWRPSLFDRMRRALEAESRIELLDDEYHSWATVSSTVAAIEAMVERGTRGSLFHFGGLTRLTTYEIGKEFAKALGYDPGVISHSLIPKKRPLQKGVPVLPEGEKFDSSLNSTAIIRALNVKASDPQTQLAEEFSLTGSM
jgi:dTDP-4-dehydrorhamnose reductase